MERSTPPPSATELGEWLGFEPEELRLNRTGRLSTRQHQTLRYDAAGDLLRGCGMLLFGMILTGMVAPNARSPLEKALLIGVIAALLVLALLFAGASAQVLRPRVRAVTGELRRGDDPWHPAIVVGGEALRISTRRWKRLPPEFPGTYRAYVDPMGRLLSLEPLENPG